MEHEFIEERGIPNAGLGEWEVFLNISIELPYLI